MSRRIFDSAEFRSLYHAWYKNTLIRRRILEYFKEREVMFKCENFPRKTTRTIQIRDGKQFDFWRRVLEKDDTYYYNMYYSLATWKKLPFWDVKNWKKTGFDKWYSERHEHMKTYDFLIDVDAPDEGKIMKTYEETKRIKAFFDRFDVPYYLRFSGTGFHFVIPYDRLGVDMSFNTADDDNIFRFKKDFLKYLADMFNYVDESAHDSMRVVKVPYSLAVYDNRVTTCFPFTSHEHFLSFDMGMTKPENVLSRRKRDLKGDCFFLFNDNWRTKGKNRCVDAFRYLGML